MGYAAERITMSNELFPGKCLFVDEHRIESMVAIELKPSYGRSSGDRLRRHIASMYFPVSSAAVIATDLWSESKSARRPAGLATSAGNTRMSRIPLATAIRSPRVRSSLASSPRFRSNTFFDRFSLVCKRHSRLNKIGTDPSRRKTISTSGGKNGITDWKVIPYSNYSVSPEILVRKSYIGIFCLMARTSSVCSGTMRAKASCDPFRPTTVDLGPPQWCPISLTRQASFLL